MSKSAGIWRSGELLAYTEREGPGRPPAASPPWMFGTLVGILTVTFVGVLSSDTLCPDHRAWVQALGTIGFVAIVGALIGLVRGWAAAPLLTLLASSLGVSIGLIDAVHSQTRGRLIALAFGVAFALAGLATVRVVQLGRWDRRVATDVDSIVSEPPTAVAEATAPSADLAAPDPVDHHREIHADS